MATKTIKAAKKMAKCAGCEGTMRGATESEKAAGIHVSCRQRLAAHKAWQTRHAAA